MPSVYVAKRLEPHQWVCSERPSRWVGRSTAMTRVAFGLRPCTRIIPILAVHNPEAHGLRILADESMDDESMDDESIWTRPTPTSRADVPRFETDIPHRGR